ncbi:MAG TPA: hypothetical protein VG759_28020 [Candidatus Angelobacter sp.]|jgi:hypothetical protein|nr:hypothetical protein [Candidatus Angelobacter sp.]
MKVAPMTIPPNKKSSNGKKSQKGATAKVANSSLDQRPRGMPAPESIRAVEEFVSPQNVKYKILKTTEMDAYDPVPSRSRRKKKT